MGDDSTTTQAATLFTGEAWFDPIEAGIRERIRGFIEALFEEELTAALGRGRCERAVGAPLGYRNGTRERQLLGSFGPVQVGVPRARMADAEGGTREWRSSALPRYARMTRQVEALIAGTYLAGANTRRVKRALAALFRGAVGKDVVSRTWRKVKADWEAWNRRDLAEEEVVRLILDGTVVRVRLDRKATNVSLLVVLGVRRDGQKLLLAVRNMGGESEAAWRGILDDLIARGLRTPEFLIVDGAAGLERALAALWPDVPAHTGTRRGSSMLFCAVPGRRLCPPPEDKPRLPDYMDDLDAVLWRELDRAPDSLAPRRRAQAAAQTIICNYAMSPALRDSLVRIGLVSLVLGLLAEEEEEVQAR